MGMEQWAGCAGMIIRFMVRKRERQRERPQPRRQVQLGNNVWARAVGEQCVRFLVVVAGGIILRYTVSEREIRTTMFGMGGDGQGVMDVLGRFIYLFFFK
jgi:hypothetical protein